MFAAGAVDYAQPSVTKVGGVTEFLKIAALAETAGVRVMAHSPYIGPGFLASARRGPAQPGFDRAFPRHPRANPMGRWTLPERPFTVPDGPGWAPIPTRRSSPPIAWTAEPRPMSNVADLRDFYQTPAGRIARRMIRRRCARQWPTCATCRCSASGTATPYLRPFAEQAERGGGGDAGATGRAAMAGRGRRPRGAAEEDELPFLDATFDRVVMVHALEASEQLPALLAEVGVLVGNGRLLVIVPNRHAGFGRARTAPLLARAIPTPRRNWPASWTVIVSPPAKTAKRCSVRRRRRADGFARARPGKKLAPAGSRALPA